MLRQAINMKMKNYKKADNWVVWSMLCSEELGILKSKNEHFLNIFSIQLLDLPSKILLEVNTFSNM